MATLFLLPARLSDIASASLAVLGFQPLSQPPAPGGWDTPVSSCPSPMTAAIMRAPQAEARASTAHPRLTPRPVLRAPDGLFYVDATVNGAPVRFLIDTGATSIILTKSDALRAGVGLNSASFTETANTAAGQTPMARVELARLAVGDAIDFNVPAIVAGDGLAVSLLGASWLTQIASMTIAGDRLLLQ